MKLPDEHVVTCCLHASGTRLRSIRGSWQMTSAEGGPILIDVVHPIHNVKAGGIRIEIPAVKEMRFDIEPGPTHDMITAAQIAGVKSFLLDIYIPFDDEKATLYSWVTHGWDCQPPRQLQPTALQGPDIYGDRWFGQAFASTRAQRRFGISGFGAFWTGVEWPDWMLA